MPHEIKLGATIRPCAGADEEIEIDGLGLLSNRYG